jgi:hypothetical protein
LSLFAAFTLLISLIIVGPYGVHAQINNVVNTTADTAQKMSVKITSPKTNQTVPIGQLTIEGISSDTPSTNCRVDVDWNDAKPMQNVTARGPGGPNDYSNWTFTYTHNYHLIMAGVNELTSKITCNHDSAAVGNLTTKYYSINITGTGNASNFSLPTSSNLSSTGTTGFYNAKFNPLLPQYSNISMQSTAVDDAAANNSNTNYEPATYYDITDNTHLTKEPSSDDSSSSSSSSEDDGHDNSDNDDKSTSDDSNDNHSNDNHSNDNHSNDNHSNDNHSNDNHSNDNKEKSNDNNKVEIHTVKYSKSTKVEKAGHDKDKLDFKGHHNNPKSGNLHKYIHNLVEKKLKRVSERIFD